MNNIKQLRIKKELTQTQLAKKLRVGQSAVGMWETGKTQPKTSTLPKLAKALDCTIDELLKEER